jgi:hypothetical protein
MDFFSKLAEKRIREAQENGVFDNLEGKGCPIDLRDYFKLPPEERMGLRLLRNAGMVPVEVDLKREIDNLKQQCAAESNLRRRSQLKREINEKSVYLNILIERRLQRRKSSI